MPETIGPSWCRPLSKALRIEQPRSGRQCVARLADDRTDVELSRELARCVRKSCRRRKGPYMIYLPNSARAVRKGALEIWIKPENG
jgi:hypothetical protein